MIESNKVDEYHNCIIADIFLKRYPDEAEWEAYCEGFHERNSAVVEIWNKENNHEYKIETDFIFN